MLEPDAQICAPDMRLIEVSQPRIQAQSETVKTPIAVVRVIVDEASP